MRWPPWSSARAKPRDEGLLRSVQQRFASFLSLLDANNRVLKLLSELEEKAQGEQLYDLSFIRRTVSEIREGVGEIINVMISLGGSDYEPLRERFTRIDTEVEVALTGAHPVVPGDYTIRLGELTREQATRAGNKNAQLGELRSKLGLRVPDGFAVSAWAYRHFIGANDLQERIDDALAAVDVKRYAELVRVSETIQEMIVSSKVPDDLASAIRSDVADVVKQSGTTHFALRSSALAEDDLLTFAGQYRSILNVRADEVIERYREIVAGKFTPKAIFYLLSHAFRESDLAMCVGCVSMVDAVSSGVVYTRDPVHPANGCLVVNSVFGLGQLLVDGTLTPDVFHVNRDGCQVVDRSIARKPERLSMKPMTGTTREPSRMLPPSATRVCTSCRACLSRSSGTTVFHRTSNGPSIARGVSSCCRRDRSNCLRRPRTPGNPRSTDSRFCSPGGPRSARGPGPARSTEPCRARTFPACPRAAFSSRITPLPGSSRF
jgi:pyruvate,water dikinase